MSSLPEQLEEKRRRFRKVLDKLGLTDKQREILVLIDNARSGDMLEDIGSKCSPPISAAAAGQRLYNLREKYRGYKRFCNYWESVVSAQKKKEFDLD